MKKDSIPLGHSDIQRVHFLWFNTNTIHLNYSHLVSLQVNILGHKHSHIDKSDKVGFVWLNRPCHVLGIVHKSILGYWFGSSWIVLVQKLAHYHRSFIMVPIADRNTHFFIVRRKSIIFNDEKSSKSVTILCSRVGMVPVSTGLVSNGKIIDKLVTRRNRTLGHLFCSIHKILLFLKKTMEMK